MAKNIYTALKPVNPADMYGPGLPPTQAGIDMSARPAPKKKVVKQAAPSIAVQPEPLPETPLSTAFAETNALRAPISSIRDSNSAKTSLDEGNKFGTTENLYMQPAVLRQLSDAISGLPEMQAQKSAMDAHGQYVKDVAQALPMGGVDVSPLMALTDAWTGSKFANSYKAPDNMAGTKLLLDYGDKQGKALEERNKMILTAAQNMKSGTAIQQQTDALSKTISAGTAPYKPPSAGSGNKTLQDALRYQRGFTQLPTYKDAQSQIAAANEVNAALTSPNWLTDATIQSSIIKAMKLYPVSDRDVKLITGSSDLSNSVKKVVNKYETGQRFTDADRTTIAQYNDYLLKRGEMHMDKAKNDYMQGMPAPTGYDHSSAGMILSPSIPKSEPRAAAQAPAANPFMDILKEIQKGRK